TTRDCAGDIYGPFGVPNITSWSSTNTGVATVDSGGNVICVSPGSANILATFQALIYTGPPGACVQQTVNPTSSGGMTVVSVEKIQYQSDSTFTDISGNLYVLKGTSVTFKAVPEPSGASWPSGKPVWGGTAGASGTGDTTSVTFNTASSSISDF